MNEKDRYDISLQGKRKKKESSSGKVVPFSRKSQKVDMPKSSKKKILVVDDEPHILSLLRINLDDQVYDIIEASDGRDAIEKAKQHLPHLILLDLMMPEVDGLAVCRTLKSNQSTSCIPIVILTARGELARKQSLECGADHFLTKPFSPLRLLAELQRFLEDVSC